MSRKEIPGSTQLWREFATPTSNLELKNTEVATMTMSEYLAHVHESVVQVLSSEDYLDPETKKITNSAWKHLVDGGVLAAPLGERGLEYRQEEIMQLGRMLSYYDLNLGLTFGIVAGLVVLPLQTYAHSDEQRELFLDRVRDGQRMGLAITERDKSGTAALDMDSSYTVNDNGTTTLTFAKHLQGLSGNGGLIVAAINTDAKKRTIGLFVVDQEDMQTQPTEMMGLPGIQYAVNTGTVILDTKTRMLTEFSGRQLFDFQDLFTKSRLLFIGMVLGHQERVEDEATQFASERYIGESLQSEMPVPRRKLRGIRTRRIITEEMFKHLATFRVDGNSLLDSGQTQDYVMEADILKVLSTQYALESASVRAELQGGAAFYKDGALQDYVDVWPFSIFEGSRWMLNTKIGHFASRKPLYDESDTGNLFDRGRVARRLDEKSKAVIDEIGVGRKSKVHEELLGQIAQRCFALGCLNKETVQKEDFQEAVAYLNLEIQQIGLEYASIQDK